MKIVWEYGMYLWYLFIKLQPYPRTEMQKRESNFQSRKIRRYTIWNFYHRNIEKKNIYFFFTNRILEKIRLNSIWTKTYIKLKNSLA